MDENNDNSFFDDGVDVYLGFGVTVTFYPLTWGAMRRLRKQYKAVFGGAEASGSDAWQDAAAEILFASASRKPDFTLTLDQFLDCIDFRNATACFRALSVASGMRKGEVASDADAARPTQPPTGGNSTAPSSPLLDGLSSNATN